MKDMIMFWFQDVTIENFLELLSLRGRYGLDIKVEVKREGNKNLTLIVTHEFGQHYAAFLKTALDTEFRTLFKIVPTIDAAESSVMLSNAVTIRQSPARTTSGQTPFVCQ
jgi:hypothetical protein